MKKGASILKRPFFVAACAGKGCQICLECCRGWFCAGKGYHFGRGMVSGNILRRNQPPNPPGTEKCSRLRGKMVPNPPGMGKCSPNTQKKAA